MSIQLLIELFHLRWAAPVLAELERQRGSRFVTLTRTLRVPRDSLRRTLDALVEMGLVARNPGYGHPLRPEYVLTEAGRPVARRCARLVAVLDGHRHVALRKWSVPVLVTLERPSRFSELRVKLPGITARALAIALKDLEAAGLVERWVEAAYPPRAVYATTPGGRRLREPMS